MINQYSSDFYKLLYAAEIRWSQTLNSLSGLSFF